jgi:hypothetical protein
MNNELGRKDVEVAMAYLVFMFVISGVRLSLNYGHQVKYECAAAPWNYTEREKLKNLFQYHFVYHKSYMH